MQRPCPCPCHSYLPHRIAMPCQSAPPSMCLQNGPVHLTASPRHQVKVGVILGCRIEHPFGHTPASPPPHTHTHIPASNLAGNAHCNFPGCCSRYLADLGDTYTHTHTHTHTHRYPLMRWRDRYMATDGWPRGSRRLQPPYRRLPGSRKTVCGAAVVSSLSQSRLPAHSLAGARPTRVPKPGEEAGKVGRLAGLRTLSLALTRGGGVRWCPSCTQLCSIMSKSASSP
ncbi:hypothetical protein CORC01_12700 [Colletotrichum orchidophilum]|uniref:Uncharacterized protein n=1 Tax=Colletotrichum orchidophilum TaxID=1209926 RepID=A0A1G4AS74_9PEZI|nr:uncharacterized protein CORC01_12700 [Colletotrichum orchidophilum]OHE92009.1 hypothetical protein CORC01_12700 [Colletotrichum orchidophilum]